jgi:DNA-binding XRE family transcriptional regulator
MAKGWTQKRCAARARISRTLEMIESHRTLPTLPTAKKLAKAFKCSWEELLGRP